MADQPSETFDAVANDLQPLDVTDTTLARDDALLTLMSEWYRYARDAKNVLQAFLIQHGGFYTSNAVAPERILIESDRGAFAAICKLAARQLPSFGEDNPVFSDLAQPVETRDSTTASASADVPASSAPKAGGSVAGERGEPPAFVIKSNAECSPDAPCAECKRLDEEFSTAFNDNQPRVWFPR